MLLACFSGGGGGGTLVMFVVRGRDIFRGTFFNPLRNYGYHFHNFFDISRNYGCHFQGIYHNFLNYGGFLAVTVDI